MIDGTKILFFHNLFLAPVWEITAATQKLHSSEFQDLLKESELSCSSLQGSQCVELVTVQEEFANINQCVNLEISERRSCHDRMRIFQGRYGIMKARSKAA